MPLNAMLTSTRAPVITAWSASSLTPEFRRSCRESARHRRRSIAFFVVAAAIVFCSSGLPGTAMAHGPTIEISHDALKPTLLNLFVGTTVHFANTVEMPGGHTIVDESGTIESPSLEKPGDGWHYTFEEVGTFEVYVREHPSAKARIVVVPKR